jgi:hypothetical protein
MLLEPEIFERILHLADTDGVVLAPAGNAGGGHRRSPRFAINTRLTVIPFAPGSEGLGGYEFLRDRNGHLQLPLASPLLVPVRDLSRGGMRFLMPHRIPLDTPFVLQLPRPLEEPLSIEASVSYWQPLEKGLFAIGAQFRRELIGFVAPTAAPTIVLPDFAEQPAARVG